MLHHLLVAGGTGDFGGDVDGDRRLLVSDIYAFGIRLLAD